VGNKTADGVTYFNDWLSGNGAVGHNVADFQVGVLNRSFDSLSLVGALKGIPACLRNACHG
jgi:hypothetical protein